MAEIQRHFRATEICVFLKPEAWTRAISAGRLRRASGKIFSQQAVADDINRSIKQRRYLSRRFKLIRQQRPTHNRCNKNGKSGDH